VKAGMTVDRYDFPARALGTPPLCSGKTTGVTVELQRMVGEYLQTEGLDPNTALPAPDVLEALGLARFLS
jgi:aldehyde:ferredoxin oxidoreductase